MSCRCLRKMGEENVGNQDYDQRFACHHQRCVLPLRIEDGDIIVVSTHI